MELFQFYWSRMFNVKCTGFVLPSPKHYFFDFGEYKIYIGVLFPWLQITTQINHDRPSQIAIPFEKEHCILFSTTTIFKLHPLSEND
jgi:hypothetical protein